MNSFDPNNQLFKALDELDICLKEKFLQVDIFICGAFAIQLLGYTRALHTQDVDTLKEIDSEDILSTIKEVGEKLGLGPRWLNDQASTVSLPDGIFRRAKPLTHWSAIKAHLIDRSDLIKLKASAFSIRRDLTSKDWEDLVLLDPSRSEIEAAILFVAEVSSPPPGATKKSLEDFEETIDELRKIIK